jgi:hypothetical protein
MLSMVVDAISFSVVLGTVNTERPKSKTPVGYNLKHSWVLVLQVDAPQATKEKNISFEPAPSKTCV